MEGLRQKQKVDSSAKKHGQPFMLGEDTDTQLQLYLDQGGVITASVVVEPVAAARGILLSYEVGRI